MQADGVTPDAYAINAAINACERGGQWEEAEMLLQEMQALGLSPDRVTYNIACVKESRVRTRSRRLLFGFVWCANSCVEGVYSFFV